jgi:hypothetical protein
MNCERCQTELEDFLYGEVGQARSAEIRAHLAACATCSAARAELEREREVFARFYEQTAIEPAAEMWQAIRARIGEEQVGQNQTGWLERLRAGTFGWLLAPALLRQVAFAILLIALSVALTTIYLKRGERSEKDVAGGAKTSPTPAPAPSLVPTSAPSPSNELAGGNEKTRPTPKANQPAVDRAAVDRVVPKPQLTDQELMNRQIARAEREYQKAVRMLDQAIAKRRDTLDPALVKEYEASLALIDNSIAASRRALRERPDDPTAGQFLLAAYAKKVELMQDIAMK